ncbi:FAD-dependent monooxygenase [Amycolatopsis jejuensis]|uniref:FAD-dependent monooxygenase n=1 Tax=Amycolatopsis jejuensis TaxID=330084 RepID=UPI0006895301|nr:FAD-dependent monooxygenase [Amycolatopsis jejuensis]
MVLDTAVAPVVIVGGGPIGLAASLLLARQGVRSIVVERRETASCGQSRAVTIQRDILALYDRLGIAGDILRRGSSWSIGRTYFGDDEILRLTFDDDGSSGYPPFINFAQYRVEELLHEAVRQQECVDLRHGETAEVVHDGADADYAVVRITDASGTARLVHASYVVAADGVGSRTRKALGIDFDGWRTNGRFLVADFRAELPFSAERRLWFSPPFYPDGIVLMHQIGDDQWRLDWQIPPELDVDDEVAAGRVHHRIRAVLDHAGIGAVEIEILRCNGWTFQQRQASRFRQHRVFLAGDSAHVVSPFGARGMNSGMEDAENLAWKLARVLSGRAPDALLDSYATERESAAAQHVLVTGDSMTFMTPSTPEGLDDRNAILAQAAADPAKAHLVDAGKLYVPHAYPDSPLTTPGRVDSLPQPGSLVPDCVLVRGGEPTTIRKIVAGRFTVIQVDPDAPDTLTFYAIDESGVTPLPPARTAGLPHPLSHAQAAVYLVRPDCYLAAVREFEDDWADHLRTAWHRATAVAQVSA